MFKKFTDKAIKVVLLAQEESRRLCHNYLGTEQILLGIIGEGTGVGAKVLKPIGINMKDARIEVQKIIGRGNGFVDVEIPFTPRAKHVSELSLEEARHLGANYIGSEHLLLGLLREGEGVAAGVLESLGADPSDIRSQVIRMVAENTEAVGAVVGGSSASGKLPTLEEYGMNLTMLAEQFISLDMGRLLAGTKYRGDFEERIKKRMEEVRQSKEIILFIDEVHTLVGAGGAKGAIDAANIMKPALARGALQCTGATTLDEYRRHIEKDPALERKFQCVGLPEPISNVYKS
ncbi:hypothetical protein Droror1_Dr00008197 [Drosera rotundifolia]